MLRLANGHKVIRTIVPTVAVEVMHLLVWGKAPAVGLFPNKAMLQNVPILVGVRMLSAAHKHIACLSHMAATLPHMVIGTCWAGSVAGEVLAGIFARILRTRQRFPATASAKPFAPLLAALYAVARLAACSAVLIEALTTINTVTHSTPSCQEYSRLAAGSPLNRGLIS
jgi:hypothetical protein